MHMGKRRSEVDVASLRPLSLNRATTDVAPARGTLFLKVVKGTNLVQAPPPAVQQKERNKMQARLSALLAGDGRADSGGAVMHAVSVTSWLTEAEPDTRTPTGAGGHGDSLGGEKIGSAGDSTTDSSASSRGGIRATAREGYGSALALLPKADAARTSTKFVSQEDKEGGASWEEEFFFSRVAGETAVRIICVDKPLSDGAEAIVVGEALIPVSRLPQNEPVEQWYGLQPPVGSGLTFTKAALLLRFLFTTTPSPTTTGAAATSATGRAASISPQPPVGSSAQKALTWGPSPEKMDGIGGPGDEGGVGGAGRAPRLGLEPGQGAEGPTGSGSDPAGFLMNARADYEVDRTLDPFAEEMETEGGQGGGFRDEGHTSSWRPQQLQLGTWGNTTGTIHAGAAAAEAALTLSTDEILPAGLVDYFLVVGPASDENGKLQVADYADCGFGSSSAPAAGANRGDEELLPATAVEVESAVLEHFPEEQREDAPFPTKVEWFCFPQGLFLVSSAGQPAPHVSSFVRFMSGVHSYGLCLTFYRQVEISEVDALEQSSATSSVGSSSPSRDNLDGLFRPQGSMYGSFRGIGGSGRRTGGGSGGIGGRRVRELGSGGIGGSGRRRGKLWCPVCLCVLTHIPVLEGLMHWLRMFHWCLVRLEREAGAGNKRPPGPSELDAAVFQITLEVPLPVPGVCAMSVRAFGERFLNCPEPEYVLPGLRELPALSFPLSLLLRSLRPQGVINLFAAVLQEGRILLHSTKPALLAAVAEGIFALMYPLQWPYAYVPVLPSCLIEHVESPQPFILGVHTEWLGDISADARQDLIVVDCDLGIVSGMRVEPLPSPVRRSLTQAVRAVLHGNLGTLDSAVRLSTPQQQQQQASNNGGGGEGRRLLSNGASPSSSSHKTAGLGVSSNAGVSSGGAAVGLAAWTTDRERGARERRAREAAGQGGGEKSGEAGDSDIRGSRGKGGREDGAGETGNKVRKARRARKHGAEARMEGLLRLEFARAMADMLYGFTECLFFLHPERPIFNGARFLQEYCEESYVPFMSIVIDTLAFKYLLETQDLPALRPFHDMLNKALSDTPKKGGRRESQATESHNADEAGASTAFNGPFPTGMAKDDFTASLGAVVGESLKGDKGQASPTAGGGSAAQPHAGGDSPPAFTIPAPRLESFLLGAGSDKDGDEDEDELNLSRGKYDGIPGSMGGRGVDDLAREGTGSNREGSGGEGAHELEQAAEESREPSPQKSQQRSPALSASLVSALVAEDVIVEDDDGSADKDAGKTIAVGPAARAAAAGAASGGVSTAAPAGRGKYDSVDGRPGAKVSDRQGTFFKSIKGVSERATAALQGRSSPPPGAGAGKGSYGVEAEEMPDEAKDDKQFAVGQKGNRNGRVSGKPESDVCYDSACEFASDGSEGLTPAQAATLTSHRQSSGASSSDKGSSRSLLSKEAAVNGDGVVTNGRDHNEDAGSGKTRASADDTDAAAVPQAAGESALEESAAQGGSGGGAVGAPGKGTAAAGGVGGDAVASPSAGPVSPRKKRVGGSIKERMKMFEHSGELRRGTDETGMGSSRWGRNAEDKGMEKIALGGSLRWPPTPGKKTGGVFDGRELVLDAGSLRRKPPTGSQGADTDQPPPSLARGAATATFSSTTAGAGAVAAEKKQVRIQPSTAPRPAPSGPPPPPPPAPARPRSITPAAKSGAAASAASSAAAAAMAAATAAAAAAERAASARGETAADGMEGVGDSGGGGGGNGGRGSLPVLGAIGKGSKDISSWKTSGSMGGSGSIEGYYEPVVVPLSAVAWSHEPVLRLGECGLPAVRKWSLADIGKMIDEDLEQALRAQTDGSSGAGLGHGSYSLKAGAGLAAAAGAGDGVELDRDSEKLLECLEVVYSSDRVSEEVVMNVEETLKNKPEVQEMLLKVLRHACRRGYASSRGPTLLHGPSFETLARFSYTLLCVCVDRADYSVAHTLLQLTGAYFQVHEGGGGVPSHHTGPTTTGVLAESAMGVTTGSGLDGVDAEAGYFSEFLSARIGRHPIFTDMKFWQHVLKEAVEANTQKLAQDKNTLASSQATVAAAAASPSGEDGGEKPGEGSLTLSPHGSDVDLQKSADLGQDTVQGNDTSEDTDNPVVDSEIVCRQVTVFLYEMAYIGMRSRTAQRYVEAVCLQYDLQQGTRNRLQETVRLVWGAAANAPGGASPPFGEPLELTAERWTEGASYSNNNDDGSVRRPSAASSLTDLGPNSGGTLSSSTHATGDNAPTTAGTASTNSGGGIDRLGGGSGGVLPPRSPQGFSATGTSAAGLRGMPAKLPSLRLGVSELASQLEAESSPTPRTPSTPKSGAVVGRYHPSTTPPHGGSKFHSGGGGTMILSPTSTRRTSARSSSYQSLSPRSPCRSDSMASGLSAQTAPTTHAGTSSRRHKSTASSASDATGGMDGGGDNEGGEAGGGSPRISSGRAADASSGADVSTAPSSQGRYFFGATGELVRALTSSASSATSATSGVSPPPDATASGRPNSRTPPSVLPGAPSSSARLGNTRSGGRGRGRGGNGGEGVVRTGELPSLLAPVDLHARDGDAVGHQGPILCLAASGSRACAGSTDCTVSVYDLSVVAKVGVLSGHTGPVSGVACGDDWVVSASTDSTLRLWQNASDSGSASTPPRRGFISLGWQAPYGASAASFKGKVLSGHTGGVVAMTAHPRRVDGQPWLALSGGEDQTIRLWDLRTRRCKVIFTGHSKPVTCLSELKDNGSNLVLSGAKDCTVRLWDINEATGCKALRKFSGHEGSVGAILKIGPFTAVSCSNDRALRTWDHRVKGSVGVLRGHTGPVTCVQQNPANRKILASGSSDGTVMMWDIRSTARGPSHTLRGHRDRVTGLLASGGSVYSCSEDGTMHEWDWDTGDIKSKFSGGGAAAGGGGSGSSRRVIGVAGRGAGGAGAGQSGGISCLAATDSALLTAGWDRTVRMWPRSSPTPKSEEAVAAAAAAAASALARGGRSGGRGSGRRR